jgi:hypothetical protein
VLSQCVEARDASCKDQRISRYRVAFYDSEPRSAACQLANWQDPSTLRVCSGGAFLKRRERVKLSVICQLQPHDQDAVLAPCI